MTQMHSNFTPEDVSLTRIDVQNMVHSKRQGPNPIAWDSMPAEIKTMLKARGLSDDATDKLIGDLDSYR